MRSLSRRRGRRFSLGACAAVALLAAPSTARAQGAGGVLLQGVLDVEGWASDSGSNLLTRNRGAPGAVGRLTLWSAFEPWRRIFLYASATLEQGNARADTLADPVEIEQLGVRYLASKWLVVDAGKMTYPLGGFAARRYSFRNPLIGNPDGYPVQYPLGVVLSGTGRWLDYRAGVVSEPIWHRGYVPEPSDALRPVAGIGITPYIGVRLGVAATAGPYLNENLTDTQLNGRSWKSYEERIVAFDFEGAWRKTELRAEWARSSYEVPRRDGRSVGNAYYYEGRYIVSPRFFAAARWERNDYPFIRPATPTVWVSRNTDFHNTEIGGGFRYDAATLLKVSYRFDHWKVTPQNQAFVGAGANALAVQLSRRFDLK